jgi:hypothetical protein
MADDRADDEPNADRSYEPPAVEPLGSAEELARGNEGSQTDQTVTDAG